MTAAEVRAAIARRHPAVSNKAPVILGAWTVIEEWKDIDVLALSSYKKPPTGAQARAIYPRVGYEVKISRSDYRRELLQPKKRVIARKLCHEFYFAVPKGLLKDNEIAYEEPEWEPKDFVRSHCTNRCMSIKSAMYNWKATDFKAQDYVVADAIEKWIICPVCNGKGYTEKSRVENEAPTLWVPRDVGLIEVTSKICQVIKKSPVIKEPEPLSNSDIGDLARWISVRPDPRHQGVAETQREQSKQSREYDKENARVFAEFEAKNKAEREAEELARIRITNPLS
jgi:hypothetical protein